MEFDETGKVSPDHIYVQPDPRPFFAKLREFDYCIPHIAKPYFDQVIEQYRAARNVAVPTVLDIGCSYGVNSALLKCDSTMDELYERYIAMDTSSPRSAVVTADREFLGACGTEQRARFVGLDNSQPALSYGLLAGFLDGAVHADLEQRDLTEPQRQRLAGTDLVISTGCVGYVGEKTLSRVLDACGEPRPWMAHFVLRMFPFASMRQRLDELGYETVAVDQLFKQRRFASAREQAQMLDTLSGVGIDPAGLEADGWLYTQLYFSRPRAETSVSVIDLAAVEVESSQTPPSSRWRPVNTSQQWSSRTFGNEDELPRVPLPTVQESCERFVEWCAPLLSTDELALTKSEVAAFGRPDGTGHKLHAALRAYDESVGVHSWLDTFWPARYLGRRDRIALNANFFFLFSRSHLGQANQHQSPQGQLERAAGLIAAAVDYKQRLDEELIEPVMQRGQPLSMEQNKYLFSTTRIPGQVQDTVRAPYSDEMPGPSLAKHIVVFYRGNMFRMDVQGEGGLAYTMDDLVAGLQAVTKAGAMRAATEDSVGHLTTKARAEWAATRAALIELDPGNGAALEDIETALLCLCLEDFAAKDTKQACDQLLHGDSANRWFDKSLSLIVFEDGTAGLNVEHCGLDGTTVLSFVDELLGMSADEHAIASQAQSQGLPTVEPIEFVLDDDVRAQARAAADSFAEFGAGTATATVSFDDFGVNRAKQLGVSPDAFVQMAYQLAHKRSKGHVGATYESIATRQYRRGRTEAMRVVTPEIFQFVSAMDDPDADAATRKAAFRAAADKHVRRAKDCQSGRAPEQHLWELQLIQAQRGDELGVPETPGLYDTPGWAKMRSDYLSTSSAPSKNIQYFGFGSTSSQCIGVAYVLLPERFNLYLSTPESVSGQMYAFADQLRAAVRELEALLEGEQQEG